MPERFDREGWSAAIDRVVDFAEIAPKPPGWSAAVCLDCGHKHYSDDPCADHQWRDSCPYVGINCHQSTPIPPRHRDGYAESDRDLPDPNTNTFDPKDDAL